VSQRLVLIRHGVTDWNREGRFQGHLDPPLGAEGEAEARLLAARIAQDPDVRPARIVSSPLRRAAQTASILASVLGGGPGRRPPPVRNDERLIEIGQGDWEGRTHAELATDDALRYAAWRRHAGAHQPPGGESIANALARVRAALDELTLADGWPLCVVSHGGTLRLVGRLLLDLRPRRAWAMDLDNASVSVLAREPGSPQWRVERWNDCRHLLGRAVLHVDESEGEPLAL
jgi:broad specificity phosphatase PhoE